MLREHASDLQFDEIMAIVSHSRGGIIELESGFMGFDSIFGPNVETGDVFDFKSISLPLVADFLSQEHDNKPIVLDFAPANHDIVQFVAQYECIYVTSSNLTSFLIHFEDSTEDSGVSPNEYFKSHLTTLDKYKDSTLIGAILVWDLFHYLSRENIIAIMARLSPMCMKGACLSAFVWQSDKIPKSPGMFRIAEPDRVEYQIRTLETARTQVLLAAQSIVNMMPSFTPLRMLASPSGLLEITLEFNELVDPPNPNVMPTHQLTGHYR